MAYSNPKLQSRYKINPTDVFKHVYMNPENISRTHHIQQILNKDPQFIVHVSNDYHRLGRYMYDHVEKKMFLCRGLQPDYMVHSFLDSDAVCVLSTTRDIFPNGNIVGIATFTFLPMRILHHDLICSHSGVQGAGDILMRVSETIGRQTNCLMIRLDSTYAAVSFYEKYGFQLQYSETGANIMIKKLTYPPAGSGLPSRRRRINTRGQTRGRCKCQKSKR